MDPLEIETSGIISDQDAAYPTLVRFEDGELLAAYTVGNGPLATGGTYCSRSLDSGKTWQDTRQVLAPSDDPPTRNSLRLSIQPPDTILAYGMVADRTEGKMAFGEQQKRDPVLSISRDRGRTWTEARKLQTLIPGPFEISNPIVVLQDGRWLAPAATMPAPDRLGERVLVFESQDHGKSWPRYSVVMEDPGHTRGFFEQKIIELQPGHLMATAWTVEWPQYTDLENHYALSNDGGRSWTNPLPTGIHGQTMTPLWLGGNRILALYNRRYGRQGVVAAIIRFSNSAWRIEDETILWDAQRHLDPRNGRDAGIHALQTFEFGLPSAIHLYNGTFLATHWCREGGDCVIRWTRFQIKGWDRKER